METSLRYGGDSKSLRFYAKEKFPVASNTFCQLNGELDTRIGAPTYLSAMIRHFFPDLSASLGVGIHYNRNKKLHFNLRGKKEYPVTANGLLTFNIKARCNADEEFREINSSGAAEFCWNIFNIRKDQDLRLKFGCDAVDRIPYLQIRENNWTFNAYWNGKWNVRYDL
ncbi:LOW QUALITY PROTEIN: outer envelope pore protein 21B, chloroplastic-like [Primulina eburnea]|uniref:LOW QUALITY PROTEIN: outer envelope pore protein 21B, chloroplastic-like n=1 Tax=Primulina eburnea TaxID=1245227 RepID=UPI003C6C5E78